MKLQIPPNPAGTHPPDPAQLRSPPSPVLPPMIPITHPSPHQPPPHPPHTNSRPPAPGDTHPPLPPLPYPPHLSQHPPPHDDRRYHGTDRFPPLPHYLPSHGTLHGLCNSSSTAEKPKLPRASQACDSCRDHKVRCDELKPCKNCHDKKVECKYRELEPKPQDKVAAHILETLMYLRFEFCRFGHRINQLEIALNRVAPSVEEQPLAPVDYDDDRAESPPPMGDGAYSSSPGEAPTVTAPIDIVEARNITRGMEEEMEVEPGPYVRPGALAIPLNHTTLAALLLKWQSIESLVRGCLEAENVKWIDEFPIRQEERRGLLRVWGRGEGVDSAKVDREPHDFGMMEVNDDYSDAGAPSPADCWGGISGSPGPGDGKLPVNPPLDFTESAIWKYVKSFQDNIQNMHPLIIPVELNAMVKLFLDSVHTSNKRAKLSYTREATVAKFASYHLPPITAPPGEVGSKRKRSSPEQSGADSPSATKLTRPTFQRSINNALVLLVLALGKICLHKDKKIPGVVPVSEPSHGSPVVRNGYPASPTQGSPPVFPLHSHTSGLPSPNENAERSGSRPSFQGGAPPMKTGFSHKRNMDVIPGLDYFAYATDILGAQLAGTSLRHIHANILAGLYHGQLGRVMESYAYIYKAGWALQIKLRPSLDRFKKLQENLPSNIMAVTEKSDNQLVFAFWTCLQLESDIIAELPLPQSHILAFEEIMPYPNLNLAKQHGFDEYTLQSYVAQLYLRKSLNQIHQMLYNPENHRGQDQGGIPTLSIINYIQNSLDIRFVPPEFKFNDNDPPANDILAARLRAKYWGAQVITYRPFIRQILESSHRGLPFMSPLPVSGGNNNFSGGDPATTAASPLESRSSQEHSEEIMQNAVKGIRALIESTRAFHGVPDRRFIITNVFGTAHAQWGNLLTLAAVFRNPILTHYINEQTLRGLFVKTIAFFRLVSQPSSALWIDMRILEGLESELWGSNKPSSVDPVNVAQQQQDGPSFSSTAIEGAVPTTFPLTHR